MRQFASRLLVTGTHPAGEISPSLKDFPSTGFGGQMAPSETPQPEMEGSSFLKARNSVRGEGLRQEVK